MHIKGKNLEKVPTSHGNGTPLLKKVFLAKDIIPGVTQIAESEFSEICSMKESIHNHPTMWEIYYVLAGKAKYFVGEEVYDVEPGDFIIVPPKTPHYQDIIEAPHRIFYWGLAI